MHACLSVLLHAEAGRSDCVAALCSFQRLLALFVSAVEHVSETLALSFLHSTMCLQLSVIIHALHQCPASAG